MTETVVGQGLQRVFEYDGLGRATLEQVDPVNKVVSTYDDLGHRVQETQTVNGHAKTITYLHDQLGGVTQLDYPPDTGVVLSYEYNGLGLPTAVQRNEEATLVSYSYIGAAVGERTVTTIGGAALKTTYSYDHHRRITGIANTITPPGGPTRTAASYSIDHDPASNPISQQTTGDDVPATGVVYAYDSLQRLTDATYTGSVEGAESFNVDLLGNRNSYTDTRPAGTTVQYGPNNLVNEYTTINGAPVAYDDAGNLVQDENGYLYTYDDKNRLVHIHKDEGGNLVPIAQYLYDARGRRTEVTDSVAGTTTRYYYDGEKVIAEYDASDMDTASRYYVCGPTSIDEQVLIRDGIGDLHVLLGTLYSVMGLVDAVGNTLESYTYDAYGRVHVSGGGAPASPYLYTARRLDVLDNGALTIQYNRARYYSSTHGRWYSRDPLEYTDGANLYEYVRSRPLITTDPRGLKGCFGIHTPTYERGPSKPLRKPKGGKWGFGPVKVSLTVSGELFYEVCDVCCSADTKHPGEWVEDWEAGGEVSITLAVSAATWGINFEIPGFKFDIWFGAQLEVYIRGKFKAVGASDWCNDDPSVRKFCYHVAGGFTLSFGLGIDVEVGWCLHFHFGADITIAGELSVSNCLTCRDGFGQCSWGKTKICLSATVTLNIDVAIISGSWVIWESDEYCL